MNTFRVLLVKFIMTFIMAIVAFSFFNVNPAGLVLLVALIATIGNYLVGDLYVLPAMGNVIASIGDGILGAVLAFIVSLITVSFNVSFASLFIFAVLIAAGEYFFHPYLSRTKNVAPEQQAPEQQQDEHSEHGEHHE